jgi:hypothetical protein
MEITPRAIARLPSALAAAARKLIRQGVEPLTQRASSHAKKAAARLCSA